VVLWALTPGGWVPGLWLKIAHAKNPRKFLGGLGASIVRVQMEAPNPP